MKTESKIYFYDDLKEKFFGEGPARLLSGVERTASLHKAAADMGMAYSKAFKIIKNAENVLGFPLLISRTGGKRGGGSALTEEGREWLRRYEEYRKSVKEAEKALFYSHYPEFAFGCVIMASGLGSRFGGNKLMADFHGRPLIEGSLSVTDNMFLSRVAVARNEDTAAYLEGRGINTILHEFPGRNDTVRLGLTEVMKEDVTGCLFFPADQPLLKKSSLRALLSAAAKEPSMIWRLSYEGTPGTPVWFPKALFPELLTLPEGKGGGVLCKKYPELVRLVPVTDPSELTDVDTQEDLLRISETC